MRTRHAAKRSARARRAPPPLAPDCALFLDIDGTLAEDAATAGRRAHRRRADGGRCRALPHYLGDALALITGRSITGVDRLFPQLRLPMAGQHGSERRDADGTIHLHAPDPDTLRQLAAVAGRPVATGIRACYLEDKGNTLALHYREVPQLAAHVHRVAALDRCDRSERSIRAAAGQAHARGAARAAATREPPSPNSWREPPFAGPPPRVRRRRQGRRVRLCRRRQPGRLVGQGGPGRTRARYRLQGHRRGAPLAAGAARANDAGPDTGSEPCAISTSR